MHKKSLPVWELFSEDARKYFETSTHNTGESVRCLSKICESRIVGACFSGLIKKVLELEVSDDS